MTDFPSARIRIGNTPPPEFNKDTLAVYQCLCCDHKDKVQVTKEEYQEVKVCPKCNGAFVDLYHIGKYPKKKDNPLDLKLLINKRILTVNEVRKHYGLQPIPLGNVIYLC